VTANIATIVPATKRTFRLPGRVMPLLPDVIAVSSDHFFNGNDRRDCQPPMATASSTATGARAYGTASPMATASATASTTATASPRGTRGPSREESTSGEPKTSATPASRGRHAERMTTPNDEEVTSESTASPSKERSKSLRHRATGETAEPSATPK